MIYLFKKTIFDCKQATLLSIKRDQGAISLFERVKLSYHLLYCDPCRQFVKQSQLLDRAGRQLNHLMSSRPPFSLSETAKSRIQKNIESL
jgi:hypothetical protein